MKTLLGYLCILSLPLFILIVSAFPDYLESITWGIMVTSFYGFFAALMAVGAVLLFWKKGERQEDTYNRFER